MSVPRLGSGEPGLAAVRQLLAGTLLLGMAGTALELLLIGHYEGVAQWTPTILLAAGLVSFTCHLRAPGRRTARLARGVMVGFLAVGAIGVALHVQGNREFELEMYPTRAGWPLVQKTLTGATPVLAPGAMTLLGLVGLAQLHNQPDSKGPVRPATGV